MWCLAFLEIRERHWSSSTYHIPTINVKTSLLAACHLFIILAGLPILDQSKLIFSFHSWLFSFANLFQFWSKAVSVWLCPLNSKRILADLWLHLSRLLLYSKNGMQNQICFQHYSRRSVFNGKINQKVFPSICLGPYKVRIAWS